MIADYFYNRVQPTFMMPSTSYWMAWIVLHRQYLISHKFNNLVKHYKNGSTEEIFKTSLKKSVYVTIQLYVIYIYVCYIGI